MYYWGLYIYSYWTTHGIYIYTIEKSRSFKANIGLKNYPSSVDRHIQKIFSSWIDMIKKNFAINNDYKSE